MSIEEMKKNAILAERTFFGTLDNAVEYLIKCKENGENVYIDFNGHMLFSCDITEESAYMEVIGMTKQQDREIREEYNQAITEEEKEAIMQKWLDIKNEHDEKVKKEAVLAERTSFGTLDKAIDYLMECRRNGQNVYIEFNNHVLFSCDVTVESAYMEVAGMTKEEDASMRDNFYNTESEEERRAISEKWASKKRKHEEEVKLEAKPAKETSFGTLDKAVEYLIECRRNGQNVYIDFNGHRLYSWYVTVTNAYIELVGMPKEEYEEYFNKFLKATTQEERDEVIKKWKEARVDQNDKDDYKEEVEVE